MVDCENEPVAASGGEDAVFEGVEAGGAVEPEVVEITGGFLLAVVMGGGGGWGLFEEVAFGVVECDDVEVVVLRQVGP